MAERWTPERRRQLTRTALLDAATEAFAEHGYHAASLDDIAERAGFTRGAIYSNFDGKADLFLAALSRQHEAQLDTFDRALQAADALDDVSWPALAALWTEVVVGDGAQLRLMLEFRLLALRNDDVARHLARFERDIEDSIAKTLEQHAADQKIRLPFGAQETGALLYAAAIGLMIHQATCDHPHPDMFGHLIDLALGDGSAG